MTATETSLDKVLFIDDAQIASMAGVKRVVHAGEKHEGNPVMTGDRDWENQKAIVGSVRKEEGLYRMWYQSSVAGSSWHMYAESDDGVEWRRPDLGLFKEPGGSPTNTFLDPAVQNHDFSSVMHTPHMGAGRSYTLLGNRPHPSRGSYIRFSEDGREWTDWSAEPVIFGYADLAWFAFDHREQVFRGMLKRFLQVRGDRRRVQHWTESGDGYRWTLPQPAIVPDEEDDAWTMGDPDRATQVYAICVARYGPVLLGFADVFRCTDMRDMNMQGVIDIQLICSRDGRKWERVGDRRPVIEIGEKGAWDGGFIRGSTSLVEDGDEIKLYYTAMDNAHGSPKKGEWKRAIGMVRWRKDGFVGLSSTGRGEVVTVPTSSGRELHINADASRGNVTAELLDDAGAAVTGFDSASCAAMTGDSLDHVLSWKHGGRPAEPGRTRSVRLKLQDAEVFSLWWE